MRNPFRYGEVVSGEYFTDREAELADLLADMRNGQNVVIISPRRFGKSSLVLRASDSLREEGALVAYVDLFRSPTKERFADHLAEALFTGLAAPLERARQKAVEIFRNLPIHPKISFSLDGTPSFEFTAADRPRDVDRTLESLLTLPGRIASERGQRVVLVLDEFQEVVKIDPHLPALMRAVFQVQPEVAHVFLGSRRHLMRHVFTDENQPMYRLAKPVILGPIERGEFASFVRERFAATGRKITDEAVERLLDITNCHPHDTQELCYFAWAIAVADDGAVTAALVERALERVVKAESARFSELWGRLAPRQRLLLTALAVDEDRAIYSEGYRRRHRLGAASSVQRSFAQLVEDDLVESSDEDVYRVPDAFLRAWLRRPV